jgi:hypothetical protein
VSLAKLALPAAIKFVTVGDFRNLLFEAAPFLF